MTLQNVKMIKGAADKNWIKNVMCKQDLTVDGWHPTEMASCSFMLIQQNKYQGVNNHIGSSLNLTWRKPMLSYYSEVKLN